LVLRLGVGVASWAAATAGVALLNGIGDESVVLVAIAGGVLIFQAADTVDLWFQSQSQSRRTVAAKLSAYLLSNGGRIGLILAGASLEAFAAMTALESGISAVGLLVAYRRFPTDKGWRMLRRQAAQLVRESWPFMVSGVSIMVYMRIDQIMIKEMLGARELGLYAAALPLSQVWQVFPSILATSLAPVIARKKAQGEILYRRAIVSVFRAFFYAGLVCTLLTVVFASSMITLLYGSTYDGAASALRVHVISNVFCFLGIGHGLWLANERRYAVRLWGTLAAGISAVVTNLVLIPTVGLLGACYSALVSQFIAAFAINAALDREGFLLQLRAIGLRSDARNNT